MNSGNEFSCKYEKYIKLRFTLSDDVRSKYLFKTINLKKIKREELNLKINNQLRNNPCMCSKCNPKTY